AVRLAERQCLVPCGAGGGVETGERHVTRGERHRRDRKLLVALGLAVGGAAVVAVHAQHLLAVRREAGEGAELLRHLGGGGVGDTGHHGGEVGTGGTALAAV